MPTVQDILYDVRALLADYNEDGVVIPSSEVSTLETNGIRFLNMAMQELYDKLKNFNTFTISRKPVKSLLGDTAYMDLQEYTGSVWYSSIVTGAKCYYFQADGEGTFHVQENVNGVWTDVAVVAFNTDHMTTFKGTIQQIGVGNEQRAVFSGNFYYTWINLALYSNPYKSDRIPEYGAWVRYDLPADFGELNKIVAEYPTRQYDVDNAYKWEGYNSFYVSFEFNGVMRVLYYPRPTLITVLTDSVAINNLKALEFIKYYVAGKIAIDENPDIANFFEQRAAELKFEAMRGQPASEQRITDVYMIRG